MHDYKDRRISYRHVHQLPLFRIAASRVLPLSDANSLQPDQPDVLLRHRAWNSLLYMLTSCRLYLSSPWMVRSKLQIYHCDNRAVINTVAG
jgi:hypothetical protein